MKKAKKPKKVPQRRTELDWIIAKLRAVLRRGSTNVIEAGNLLIKSRKHVERGDWQEWLTDNFDLSLRTAQNYYSAAEYVARAKEQSATVADWPNLSPSVLYHLAAGHFDKDVESAILAASKKGRVDEDAMWAIRDRLEPPDDDAADDDDTGADADDDDINLSGVKKDAESEAILDGPPPAVPPTADPPQPPDFASQDFDKAIGTLNRLKTKLPAQFAQTNHSADDLESVELFIHAVTKARRA